MSRDLAELPTCTRCALAQSRQRVVVGSGPLNPSLMVIGEAPGRDEDEGGEPFIGRSGRLLFQLIQEEVGLSRAQCFVTNVVKCRPPANRTPTREELIACRPWLSEQFQLVRAPLVLALGNTAARSVFRFEQGIGVTHGQIVKLGGGLGLATYHPAAALRGGASVVDVMRADLRILKTLVAGP
ncbi:MAG: uracil-DNA glycosylase [Acidimicrobiales bacterium]|jgi:DNA polymerase